MGSYGVGVSKAEEFLISALHRISQSWIHSSSTETVISGPDIGMTLGDTGILDILIDLAAIDSKKIIS